MNKFLDLVTEHDVYRKGVINLQASENVMSRDALKCLGSDMASRYSLYEPAIKSDAYGGTGYSEEVLHETEMLASEVFGTKFSIGGEINFLLLIKNSMPMISRHGNKRVMG